MTPQWLGWAQRLQAIAQIGLTYAINEFDRERYEQIREIAVEMAAKGSGDEAALIRGLFSQDEGYVTPKVDVRGVIFRDDKILLVQEVMDEHRWTLPGGWADIGDSPAEAVIREIREESGFEARAIKLLAAYDRSRHDHTPSAFYTFKLFFLCEISGGEARSSHETGEVCFFGEHELPADLSLGRVTARQIRRFFEHHRQPDLPTDFD